MTPTEVIEVVGTLVDRWCDRHALAPLRHIVRAYPLISGLTDEWAELLVALENIRAFCRDELPPREEDEVERCISAIQRLVYR